MGKRSAATLLDNVRPLILEHEHTTQKNTAPTVIKSGRSNAFDDGSPFAPLTAGEPDSSLNKLGIRA
jgi:hypothetical protein